MITTLIDLIDRSMFARRNAVVAIFTFFTLILGYQASKIELDASFTKNIPLQHEYMQVYMQYQDEFGGANNVLISLCDASGNIYNAPFFDTLKKVHDQLFFINGVDRVSVKSLYSPSVRFTEVVEDGFAGGPVIPASFTATDADFDKVTSNVEKSGQVGRLVSNDYSCALVQARLLAQDPETGEAVETLAIANQLEDDIRGQFQTDTISVHIIGFAKMVGDVASGAMSVVGFFIISILITTYLVYVFCKSWKLTFFPIFCSFVAIVWKVGILSSLGYGIDPMSILLPFLIFAIGVSHGVQMINAIKQRVVIGETAKVASSKAFRLLALPGLIALLSDSVGFLTILSIDIGIIQELAMSASIGVGVIILTNLLLLPVLISYLDLSQCCKQKDKPLFDWQKLSFLANKKATVVSLIIAANLFVFGVIKSNDMKVGDLHAGAPALHTNSTYNQDTFLITEKYSVSVDILTIISETEPDGCTHHSIMRRIDELQWRLRNVDGVQGAVSLSDVSKVVNSGYNEGNAKWRVLAKDQTVLAQSVARVPTNSGLLNTDCSAIPILLFLEDHKAETIERVIAEFEKVKGDYQTDELKFRLAAGPVGVIAATNQAVTAAQTPMLLLVYGTVILLCLISFRSIKATAAVILPLFIVSTLAQALMTMLDIGLTVYTLPVIALGVGIGVDYGIYILSNMVIYLREGESVEQAYHKSLKERGGAVIFTGITLAIGVSTWMFSSLKFQVDMGILLTFMFVVNMIAAITIIPALSRFFWSKQNTENQ